MKFGSLRSESDRTASIIILICLTIVAVGCILGMGYLFEYNFYEAGDDGKTAKSIAVQIYSSEDTVQAKDYYNCLVEKHDEYRLNYYSERFSTDNSNFAFTINEINGSVIFDSTINGDTSFEEITDNSEYCGTSDFYTFSDDGEMIPLVLKYAIIAENMQTATDKYTHAFRWIDAANTLRYWLFVVLFLTILIIVILLSFMTINAGNKDDENEEIVPGFIDKIPLDICTLFLILLFIVAWVVIGLTSAAAVEMVLNNVVVMITCVAAILVLMTYLTTLSVRVKMGRFYKNTVIYMIIRKFKRKTPRKIRRNINNKTTVFRKLVAGIVVFFLVEAAILAVTAYLGILSKDFNSSSVLLMFIIIWGMTRLIIIPIFAMIAINLYYVKEEGQRLAEGVLGDEIAGKLSISAIRAHGKNLDQIKKEINKAVEQELKSERLKNELITNVSHDIKTPLTSIKSYVDFLQRDDLTESQRKEYLEIVAKHTEKLAVLTKNLIEVSQISSGNIEVKREKTSLNIIIEQTIEEFALKLEQNELIPRVTMPEKDIYIMGDGEWLWRIFSNLFNNACKYTTPGTDVEISLEENNGKAHICISNLSNSPVNIEGDELFERFVRGDGSRHTEGNGLGLSIAKSLAELQGGTLDVSVKDNKFTVFVIFDAVE